MKALGLPIGLSFAFWTIVGLIRYYYETVINPFKPDPTKIPKLSQIAAIIPAHNEELVIRSSIKALKKKLNTDQIYVASDGSKDRTTRRARMEGVHVTDINPGKGKAKALVHLIDTFKLYKRYQFILIVDADTRLDETFFDKALSMLADPQISVVFGTPNIIWPKYSLFNPKYLFICYRERLNLILRYMMGYGQTWKVFNSNYVIPGFATLYRTKILSQLQIDTPGLLIEDFNLAFQLHKKRLGKIGHHPSIIAWDQHPDNLKDYWSQVRRWNIGFFQTVRRWRVWPSFFWIALGVFTLEVFINSIFILFSPFLLLYLLIPFIPINTPLDNYFFLYHAIGPYQHVTLIELFILAFVLDYVVSVIVSMITQKPQFIFWGLFFYFLHIVTSLILFSAIVPGFFKTSTGRWTSPARQEVD